MLKPFRDLAPTVAELVGPMPYLALNSAFDDLYPSGLRHYWKASFVKELTDDAIAAHVEHGSQVPEMTSTMHIYPINGACHRVAPDATAFAYRDANFATVIAGMWPDEKDDERNIAWVRDYYEATAPFSEDGGYINFMAEDDQGRIGANYRGNYDRLREVKADLRPRQPVPAQPEHPAGLTRLGVSRLFLHSSAGKEIPHEHDAREGRGLHAAAHRRRRDRHGPPGLGRTIRPRHLRHRGRRSRRRRCTTSRSWPTATPPRSTSW